MRRAAAIAATAVALTTAAGGAQAATLSSPPAPTASQVEAAAQHAAAPGLNVAFAVADERMRVRGWRLTRHFQSASVTKAMLLVAYLSRPGQRRRPLSRADRRLLGPMIRSSANEPAAIVYRHVGDGGLRRLAHRAGMRRFSSSHVLFGWQWGWGEARITAADQARFMVRLPSLVPRLHRAYARKLLTSIVAEHRWGIAAVAGDRWTTLFKGGWGAPTETGVLVNQVARLEGRRGAAGIAVLTSGNHTYDHGYALIGEIAALLLGPPPS